MKAIVYDAPRQFQYKDVPEPEIQPDDVLVRIDACGLCGTDLHIHEGEFAPNFPLIPGHEFTGEIVALGGSVKGLKAKAAGRRKQQRIVRQMLLLHARRLSALSQFASLRGDPEWRIRAISPDQSGSNISDRQSHLPRSGHGGAKSCAVHGMEVLAMKPGSDVLLFGAGPTGQVLAQLLKLNGAGRLVVAAPAWAEIGAGRPSCGRCNRSDRPKKSRQTPESFARVKSDRV